MEGAEGPFAPIQFRSPTRSPKPHYKSKAPLLPGHSIRKQYRDGSAEAKSENIMALDLKQRCPRTKVSENIVAMDLRRRHLNKYCAEAAVRIPDHMI